VELIFLSPEDEKGFPVQWGCALAWSSRQLPVSARLHARRARP